MSSDIFQGLSAFSLTPVTPDGAVDTDALSVMLERLINAEVDSIGLLGSTGVYAYLDRQEWSRALAAATEVINGRVPLIVGIGTLRTDWSQQFAREAENAGADGLLLAPVSYTPLMSDEVAEHFKQVAGETTLPLCIYNNPSTTHFTFTEALLTQLSEHKNIAAVKMPAPSDGDFSGEISRLRMKVSPDFAIGYSGDWNAASALTAGSDAWYSVVAGLLPVPALRLARSAQTGMHYEAEMWNKAFEPLWELFRHYGSLRVMYTLADVLGLRAGNPPAPLKRIPADAEKTVFEAVEIVQQQLHSVSG